MRVSGQSLLSFSLLNSPHPSTMNKIVLLSFLVAAFVAVSSARPEPEIVAWHELEEGIAESPRFARAVYSFRKPFCMCIIAENCPCRNGGNQRGSIEGVFKTQN
ncbi:hypothetical protein PRIPAC_71779 [Pristionchus pacificus]|uniref:Uncharacterized protein n=1 Tax=Pristionchus pacificus TaxID=54126 RepID=A0A454XX98_PRIPA|nr:hypothetical protein PRIPAC_71779 [Pristionchus pacificus]|eukprot:PDM81110.1 hypothetical protein PRIPAC_36113 [Pristionchus pacificus]